MKASAGRVLLTATLFMPPHLSYPVFIFHNNQAHDHDPVTHKSFISRTLLSRSLDGWIPNSIN